MTKYLAKYLRFGTHGEDFSLLDFIHQMVFDLPIFKGWRHKLPLYAGVLNSFG